MEFGLFYLFTLYYRVKLAKERSAVFIMSISFITQIISLLDFYLFIFLDF